MKLGLFRRQGGQSDPLADAPKHEQTPEDAEKLSGIWKLTALPRAEFDITYGQLIDRSVYYLSRAPENGWPETKYGDVRAAMFRLMFYALKVRKGRILPRGVPSEDAARLSELMSYLVAVIVCLEQVASVAGTVLVSGSLEKRWTPTIAPCPSGRKVIGRRPVPTSFALLLYTQLVPVEGQEWIGQEGAGLTALLRYFDSPKRSELYELISLAKSKAFPDAQSTTAIDLDDPVEHDQAPSSEEKFSALNPTESDGTPTDQPKPKGWQFFHWLQNQVSDSGESLNQDSSNVHVLPGGAVFLVSPDAFAGYAEETGVSAKNIQNSVLRLKMHRVIEGGRTHFAAKIPGRKSIRGFVFKDGAAVLGDHLKDVSPNLTMVFDD